MGILYKAELERRFNNGQLVINPRKTGGLLDLQPASYDLTAGTVIWKDAAGSLQQVTHKPWTATQDRVTLQPGQMLSVITLEELRLPKDCCAMVFSRNSLALNGIFAFNAGHVDPGYSGPIIIRLLSLRSTPYTFYIGDPIFTVVFEELEVKEGDRPYLAERGQMKMEDAVKRVTAFADVALSNALFSLYEHQLQQRLAAYSEATLATLREHMEREFVRESKLKFTLFAWFATAVITAVTVIGGIVALVANLGKIAGKLK